MAQFRYDFSSVSVMVVEDNDYIRSVLFGVLQSLGCGRVSKFKDGKEAVDYLQLMSMSPERAGALGVDFVITDMLMEPVDGFGLLKWIRMSKDSPDRFLPVIMISGFVDRDALARARDLGVTEFLAKPFSVNSVAKKIEAVIERPRPFIRSETYFGPDRRRTRLAGYNGPERREQTEADCEVVYE
jgi:two-component system, chemotaxis family, chemotaxis protein CheY